MTHQEMLEQVSDEVRNKNITTKITRWLNMAITELGATYVFGYLNKYFSKTTTAGSPDITLDTDFHWLKTIQIPSQSKKLWPEDEQTIAESYPLYRTQTGVIEKYYMNGNILSTWQVDGAGGTTITGSYQKKPKVLLPDFSVACDLPEEWHLLVSQKAITRGYRYESRTEDVLTSERAEADLLRKLGNAVHKRLDNPLVMGGNSSRRRPAPPRFPSNYPQFWR